MNYLQCPTVYKGKGKSIFLAGGISNASDWQKIMVELLKDTSLTLLNPRRADFDASDATMSIKQIHWEHDHLTKADAILFWFVPETLCPITLYELGAWSGTKKKLFIGVHPKYKRKLDVEIQTKIARPEIEIVYSLKELAEQVKEWSTHE